jgi:tetratricopeptide (TPR) repeat protein
MVSMQNMKRNFLMTLYFNYENNAFKADEYAEMLTKEFPDNPVFERWRGRIEAKKGNFVAASIIFRNVIDKGDSGLTGYNVSKTKREADYYVAYQYFNTNKLDSAMIYFNDCAKISKQVDGDEDSGFQVNAVMYIGMINDLWNKRDVAISNYKRVLDMDEYANSHKRAEELIEKPFKK